MITKETSMTFYNLAYASMASNLVWPAQKSSCHTRICYSKAERKGRWKLLSKGIFRKSHSFLKALFFLPGSGENGDMVDLKRLTEWIECFGCLWEKTFPKHSARLEMHPSRKTGIPMVGRVFKKPIFYDLVIATCLIFFCFPSQGNSQGYHKAYGAGNDNFENADLTKTAGNNLIMYGQTENVDSQYFILKVDTAGNQQWVKKVDKAILNDVTALPDSGVAFTGAVGNDTTNETDLLLFKLDKNGRLAWEKNFYNEGGSRGLFIDYVDSTTFSGKAWSEGLWVLGSKKPNPQDCIIIGFTTDLQGEIKEDAVGTPNYTKLGYQFIETIKGVYTTERHQFIYGNPAINYRNIFVVTLTRGLSLVSSNQFSGDDTLDPEGMVGINGKLYIGGNIKENPINRTFLLSALKRDLVSRSISPVIDTMVSYRSALTSDRSALKSEGLTLTADQRLLFTGDDFLMATDTNQKFLWSKQFVGQLNDEISHNTGIKAQSFPGRKHYATWTGDDFNLSGIKGNKFTESPCIDSFRVNSKGLSPTSTTFSQGWGGGLEITRDSVTRLSVKDEDLVPSNRCVKDTPRAGFRVEDSVICGSGCIQAFDTSQNAAEWRWYGNGDSTREQNPEWCFEDTGSFPIIQIVKNNFGSDTAQKRIRVFPNPEVDAGDDTAICRGDQAQLNASGGTTYQWEPELFPKLPPQPDPIVRPDSTATYTVKANDDRGCSAKDTIRVKVKQEPAPIEPFDTTICGFDSVTLDGKNPDFNHEWNTGAREQTITVRGEGSYTVKAGNSCFQEKGTFRVETRPCETRYYIPDAFSPNNDGINDEFSLKGEFIEEVSLTIYNRWGQRVYKETGVNPSWNGFHEGQKVPSGLYLYQFDIKGAFGGRFTEHGMVKVVK